MKKITPIVWPRTAKTNNIRVAYPEPAEQMRPGGKKAVIGHFNWGVDERMLLDSYERWERNP